MEKKIEKSDSHKLYNGEVELKFDKAKHHYTVDGNTVDGVTSILQIINKPALIYWAANKASEYVDKFLEVGKVVDEIQKKNLVDGCKTAHRLLKEAAGDSGTLLHAWIESYIKGENPPTPTNEILKKNAEQFLEWVKENEVKFIDTERIIYSKKYGYAGTLDATAKVKGKNVIIDIKTSSGIYPEMFLQTAAYKQALQEEFPELPIAHTVIVRCGKDGSFQVKEMNNFEENLQAFIGALTLYRWMKQENFKAKQNV